MHPSAYTQRQNAAYARIQAVSEFLAQSIPQPEGTPKLSEISHPDPNLRALLKLEATTALLVRVAEASGYEEQAPEQFKPNEFVVGDQTQEAPDTAAESATDEPIPDDLDRSHGRRTGHRGKSR